MMVMMANTGSYYGQWVITNGIQWLFHGQMMLHDGKFVVNVANDVESPLMMTNDGS